MAFMLGGFADGLFKGASQAIQLYGMYHNVREQQADSEARDAYAEAMKTPTPSALPTGDATANLPASPEETAAAPAETTTTDPQRDSRARARIRDRFAAAEETPRDGEAGGSTAGTDVRCTGCAQHAAER